jgi:hypothetical protein
MLIQHLALVSTSKKISASDVSLTASALQKQATRDLGPIWGIRATVDSFPNLKSVPVGYWPIIVMDNIHSEDAAGYHADNHHQPFARVQVDDGWQLTCSHEMCEMLVDPFGNRLVTSKSIGKDKGRVQYLVEVCDPCEGTQFAYSVNGILMSDFYTPHFFDPVTNPAVRYSYTGGLKHPLEVAKDGYLSWYNPTEKKWYQATFFGSKLKISDITGSMSGKGSLRNQIDGITRNPNQKASYKKLMAAHRSHEAESEASMEAYGEHWEHLAIGD